MTSGRFWRDVSNPTRTFLHFLRGVESIPRCSKRSNDDTRTAFGAMRKTKFDDYSKGNVLNYAT